MVRTEPFGVAYTSPFWKLWVHPVVSQACSAVGQPRVALTPPACADAVRITPFMMNVPAAEDATRPFWNDCCEPLPLGPVTVTNLLSGTPSEAAPPFAPK